MSHSLKINYKQNVDNVKNPTAGSEHGLHPLLMPMERFSSMRMEIFPTTFFVMYGFVDRMSVFDGMGVFRDLDYHMMASVTRTK